MGGKSRFHKPLTGAGLTGAMSASYCQNKCRTGVAMSASVLACFRPYWPVLKGAVAGFQK